MLDNSLRTETHSLSLFVEADYDGLFFVCLFRTTAVVVCNSFHFLVDVNFRNQMPQYLTKAREANYAMLACRIIYVFTLIVKSPIRLFVFIADFHYREIFQFIRKFINFIVWWSVNDAYEDLVLVIKL